MARPRKSIKVIQLEQKNHMTKREIAVRKREEEKLISGSKLKEAKNVREDPVAHKEFVRIRKLMRAIEKDDDLYSGQLNTYCELTSEIERLKVEKAIHDQELEELRETRHEFDDYVAYYDLLTKITKRIDDLDKRIDQKRAHREKIDREKTNI